MAEKQAIDFALHWLPKRSQYRFRFLRYGGGYIHCWYWYVSRSVSIKLHEAGALKVFLTALVVILVAGFILFLLIGLPIGLLNGSITFSNEVIVAPLPRVLVN